MVYVKKEKSGLKKRRFCGAFYIEREQGKGAGAHKKFRKI
jgi:hypothetical protein